MWSFFRFYKNFNVFQFIAVICRIPESKCKHSGAKILPPTPLNVDLLEKWKEVDVTATEGMFVFVTVNILRKTIYLYLIVILKDLNLLFTFFHIFCFSYASFSVIVIFCTLLSLLHFLRCDVIKNRSKKVVRLTNMM